MVRVVRARRPASQIQLDSDGFAGGAAMHQQFARRTCHIARFQSASRSRSAGHDQPVTVSQSRTPDGIAVPWPVVFAFVFVFVMAEVRLFHFSFFFSFLAAADGRVGGLCITPPPVPRSGAHTRIMSAQSAVGTRHLPSDTACFRARPPASVRRRIDRQLTAAAPPPSATTDALQRAVISERHRGDGQLWAKRGEPGSKADLSALDCSPARVPEEYSEE